MNESSDDQTDDPFGDMHVLSPATLLDVLNMSSSPVSECLEIIGQPCHPRLRSRNDYKKTPTRRDPLTSKNPTYKGPAVRIPPAYLNIADQYYIGVCLATVLHETRKIRYIHPYELESIDHQDRNDRVNNIVWYPIEDEDRNGFKSFSDLRIVKKTETDLKIEGGLRPFHGHNSNLFDNSVPQLTTGRQIVQEYNLKKTQLAFTIGIKTNINDKFPTIRSDEFTFSDEMIADAEKEAGEDDNLTESTAKDNSPPSECHVRTYAPRHGYADEEEEMLIFCTTKLDIKKYGELEVTFVSDAPDIFWTEKANADGIRVIDRMVSFRIPKFPFTISRLIPVKVILHQKGRTFIPIEYFYEPKYVAQCPTCQANMTINPTTTTTNNLTTIATNNPTTIAINNPNKRARFSPRPQIDDENQIDAVIHMFEEKLELRHSKSEPEPQTSLNSSDTNKINDDFDKQIGKCVESYFTDNDFKPTLRIFRPFVRKRPELLHNAIHHNHSELIPTFISIAKIDLLREKNQFGETALLHAARLNRVDIIKVLLEKQYSDKLLEDTNNKGQNIFHILASNTDSDEILKLLTDHLLKNSINIQEKFDNLDEESHTPLQLAISKNNLVATRHFFKYFKKDVLKTSDHSGDNLIHLAVRYGDLSMLKYLLDEGQLIAQGTQSNLTKTPIELAHSLKHNDMVEYFKNIYPEPEDDESSEND